MGRKSVLGDVSLVAGGLVGDVFGGVLHGDGW